MSTLSGPQLTQLALSAGFPPTDAQTAAAVALAESAGRTDAISPTGDYGIWQINQRAHPDLFRQYIWSDPSQNAKMAYSVYHAAGNSFTPWSTFKSGRYRVFTGQVGSANSSGILAGALAGASLAPGGSAADPSQAASTDQVVSFITQASDPSFWTRVAMFLAGVLLIGAALHGLLSRSGAYQGLAKKAVAVLV